MEECKLAEFSYDALPIELNFKQEDKSKLLSVDEEEEMLKELKELLKKKEI